MRRSLTPAVALAAVLAAGLAGCAAGGDASSSDAGTTMANAELHPTGDEGRWFDSAFRSGSVVPYATANTLCGLADGILLEMQRGPGIDTHVQARDLRSGDVIWDRADAGCSKGAMGDGALLVSPQYSRSGTWSFVDPVTGEATQEFSLDPSLMGGRFVTEVDGIRIIELERRLLVGVGPDGVVWEHELGDAGEITPLGDGAIGVARGLEDRIEIIDGRTGEQRSEHEGVSTGKFHWASDGYVLNINQSDPEYAYFDLDGEEVDRTKRHSVYGFTPKPRDGVTFSIEDFLTAEKVTAVGLDGRPALFDVGYEDYATQAGPIDELPAGMLMVRAVSADGSLMLFGDEETDDLVVIGASGDEVLRWPAPASTEVRVESGMIVLEQGNATTVLQPGE